MNKIKMIKGAAAYAAPLVEVLKLTPQTLICTSFNSEAFDDEENCSGTFEIDY
ncbi:MAG: hypothetical protein ACI3ZF_02425 [Candidatus Cryptobacteroides sp.]